MRRTRVDRRVNSRAGRPGLETLETRQLLASLPPALEPIPAQSPNVSSVSSRSDELVGFSRTRDQYDVDGSGQSVAVIDTGVDYTHSALGGGFGPGAKVEAGYDFAMGDRDPNATTWDHGTAVAGLIASSDTEHPGVAPGADVVALRVFGDDNKGDFNRIADALEWVVENHETYDISVVNLSISDGKNYILNWFTYDGGVGQRISELVTKLKALNIPVVSATGNSFSGQQGVGFTAIIADTVSVTATDNNDRIVANAQRLGEEKGGVRATDIAAPGSALVAPVKGGGFMTVEGTSFAASVVSGSILLLQQIYRSRFGVLPKVDDVVGWLKKGATQIQDSATGISIGRIDLEKAAALVPSSAPKPTPAKPPLPTVPVTPSPAPPVVVTPVPNPTPSTPTPLPTVPSVPPSKGQGSEETKQESPPATTVNERPQVPAPSEPVEVPATTTPDDGGQASSPDEVTVPSEPEETPGEPTTGASETPQHGEALAPRWVNLLTQLDGKLTTVQVWEASRATSTVGVRVKGDRLWSWSQGDGVNALGQVRPAGDERDRVARHTTLGAARAARWANLLQNRLPKTRFVQHHPGR